MGSRCSLRMRGKPSLSAQSDGSAEHRPARPHLRGRRRDRAVTLGNRRRKAVWEILSSCASGRVCRRAFTASVLALALLVPQVTSANPCNAAARTAARETGVPPDLLLAIARVESGRASAPDAPFAPQPWAVNVAGEGRWFESRNAALRHLRAVRTAGIASFDVGCFQINHRWHGRAFASLDEMIAPGNNARHAARFLKRLYAETGDWMLAAGIYHSRRPAAAERYRARVARARSALASKPAPASRVRDMPARATVRRATSEASAAALSGSLADHAWPAAAPLLGGMRAPRGNASLLSHGRLATIGLLPAAPHLRLLPRGN